MQLSTHTDTRTHTSSVLNHPAEEELAGESDAYLTKIGHTAYQNKKSITADRASQQHPPEIKRHGLPMTSIMSSIPEPTSLKNSSSSLSREQLTPKSDNTVFSVSHSKTIWTTQPPPGNCEFYWHAVLLMTSGGSVLICGMVLSGLYFTGISVTTTNILGPALLSIGLMVLVVGVVLVPIMREMRNQSATKRLCNYYKPQLNP